MWKYNPQYVESEYDENYSYYIKNRNEDHANWNIVSIDSEVLSLLGFNNKKEAVSKIGEAVYKAEVAKFALSHADSVFESTAIGDDAGKDTIAIREESKINPGKVFLVKRESKYDRYVLNGREIAFYSKKISNIDNKLVPTTLLTNIWTDISWEGIASEGGVKLKKGKKPERLLRRIIDMATEPGEFVLDFFVGSGTTCAVAHKMNRRYIGIEQLSYGDNDSTIRLGNVIKGDQTGVSKAVGWKKGGSFIYCELMKLNEKFVEKTLSATKPEELLNLWSEIQQSGYISYRVNVKIFGENIDDFTQLDLESQKRFLLEVLDKNQLYVNLSEIDDQDYGVSEVDKKLNSSFYARD